MNLLDRLRSTILALVNVALPRLSCRLGFVTVWVSRRPGERGTSAELGRGEPDTSELPWFGPCSALACEATGSLETKLWRFGSVCRDGCHRSRWWRVESQESARAEARLASPSYREGEGAFCRRPTQTPLGRL